MRGKAFLDTNILVYLYSAKEQDKREVAQTILNKHDCITSVQVFNEASNVWFRKFNWNGDKIKKHLDNIELVCIEVLTVGRDTINKALSLKDVYKFSYFDSLTLASAIEGKCATVFTEDMQDGQTIENSIIIKNPFSDLRK